MKICRLDGQTIPPSRFVRPQHIKTDTHFILNTEKYVVEIVYHSSMFYAPDFYNVAVKTKDGNLIWDGGKTLFLDTLFSVDFISDRYEQMVLTRVNATDSPHHMQVLLVDLKTGMASPVTEESNIAIAGHLVSMNAYFYHQHNATWYVDMRSKTTHNLSEKITKQFEKILTWGTCCIDECILVITPGQTNNVSLFNIKEESIEDQGTIPIRTNELSSPDLGPILHNKKNVVSVYYSVLQSNGVRKHQCTELFEVEQTGGNKD